MGVDVDKARAQLISSFASISSLPLRGNLANFADAAANNSHIGFRQIRHLCIGNGAAADHKDRDRGNKLSIPDYGFC